MFLLSPLGSEDPRSTAQFCSNSQVSLVRNIIRHNLSLSIQTEPRQDHVFTGRKWSICKAKCVAQTRDPVDRIQGRYEIYTDLLSHPDTDHCSHWPDGPGWRIKAAESICQSNVKVAVCKQMC